MTTPKRERPAAGPGESGDAHADVQAHSSSTAHILMDASRITPKPVDWLWPGWLARGKFHVIAGKPGTGKTTAMLAWIASVTSGRPLPDGTITKPGRAVIWSGEDDSDDTLVPRLLAAGADTSRIRILPGTFDPGSDEDMAWLADVLADKRIDFILIDPLALALNGDSHKNAEVRRDLQPLIDLAGKTHAALVGVHHFSKGTKGLDPLERLNGSVALGAVPRVVFGTCQMLGGGFMLARIKVSNARDGDGYRYAIQRDTVQGPDGPIETSRIAWGERVTGRPDALLSEAESGPSTHNEAEDFVTAMMADGDRSSADVLAEARKVGLSAHAVHHARQRLGIRLRKTGMAGGWTWLSPKNPIPGTGTSSPSSPSTTSSKKQKRENKTKKGGIRDWDSSGQLNNGVLEEHARARAEVQP